MHEIIGWMAAVLTTASFIPQAIKVIKTRNTKDLSLAMYIIFSTGVFMWLLYGIALQSIPIILANSATLLLALTILYTKIRHG